MERPVPNLEKFGTPRSKLGEVWNAPFQTWRSLERPVPNLEKLDRLLVSDDDDDADLFSWGKEDDDAADWVSGLVWVGGARNSYISQ